jgi:alkylation response protein AidB-like acyl-CoA dehydrogenase
VDFGFGGENERDASSIRAFLEEAMTPEETRSQRDPLDLSGVAEPFERALHRAAGESGWLGAPAGTQSVFNRLVAEYDAPLIDTAWTLAGHALTTYASTDQRERFLPLVQRGEIELCIAYTEAGAGSDLSAIEAAAVPTGDGFSLTGRKVLVTGAHKADWCLTIARTRDDVPARHGSSMFLVDMTLPGIAVTRRITMNDWTLDEIEFAGVALGADALLGERDAGWRQMVGAVAAERTGAFHLGFARHVLDALIAHVRTVDGRGRRPADDPLVRDRVTQLSLELDAARRLGARTLWGIERGEPGPALPPMGKVYATELLQRIAQAATEIAGPAGLVHAALFDSPSPYAAGGGRFAWEYLERVHGTIGGGANEVQRDAIAQLGLGLPRTRR